MQQGLIRHDFFLFNGVDAYGEANKTPGDKLYYAENSRFSGGRWGSRMGFSLFDEFSGGTNIKGLMGYERFPSGVSTEYVVAYYNSKFERVDMDGVSSSITATGWTGGDIAVEGLSYNGSLYVGDGSDLIGKIDDTTFSTIASSPSARLLEEWGEKFWAVDNAAPATAQYTLTATAGSPANIETWTGAGTGAELIGKGGRIESLRKLDKKLYAFKRDMIEEFYDIDLSSTYPQPLHQPIARTAGAISHRATVIVENDIWFLTPDLQIRSLGAEAGYLQSEPRVKDMSEVIDRYKSSLDTDQSESCASYSQGIVKFSLKSRGSSQNDILFIYDINSRGWGFDKHTSPTCFVDNIGGDSFFCIGGTNGKLFKDNSGYSDNGSPMSFTGRTGLKDDARPDLKKYARYLYVRGARSEDVVTDFKLVGEDYEVLETHTLDAPTSAEIAAGATSVGGLGRTVGDIVGEEGYAGTETGAPPVYRFNKEFSCGSNDRMFGCEVVTFLTGQRIFIDDIKLKYIPRETYPTS